MSEPINLRRARKDRARQMKRQKGAENAASFGRSKQEKHIQKQEDSALQMRLDNHRLERDEDKSN